MAALICLMPHNTRHNLLAISDCNDLQHKHGYVSTNNIIFTGIRHALDCIQLLDNDSQSLESYSSQCGSLWRSRMELDERDIGNRRQIFRRCGHISSSPSKYPCRPSSFSSAPPLSCQRGNPITLLHSLCILDCLLSSRHESFLLLHVPKHVLSWFDEHYACAVVWWRFWNDVDLANPEITPSAMCELSSRMAKSNNNHVLIIQVSPWFSPWWTM